MKVKFVLHKKHLWNGTTNIMKSAMTIGIAIAGAFYACTQANAAALPNDRHTPLRAAVPHSDATNSALSNAMAGHSHDEFQLTGEAPPLTAKTLFWQLAQNMHASLDTYQHTLVPFYGRGSGMSTHISTPLAGISASYYAESPKATPVINGVAAKPGVSGDTKFMLAVPYLEKVRLFGGYSYQRTEGDQKRKGASFGFQTDLFGALSIDTSFMRKRRGKTATKVLFSLSMPVSGFKF
jgi:hypothetical protein